MQLLRVEWVAGVMALVELDVIYKTVEMKLMMIDYLTERKNVQDDEENTCELGLYLTNIWNSHYILHIHNQKCFSGASSLVSQVSLYHKLIDDFQPIPIK